MVAPALLRGDRVDERDRPSAGVGAHRPGGGEEEDAGEQRAARNIGAVEEGELQHGADRGGDTDHPIVQRDDGGRDDEHDEEPDRERRRADRLGITLEETGDQEEDHRHVEQGDAECAVTRDPGRAPTEPVERPHQEPVDAEEAGDAGPVGDAEHHAQEQEEREEDRDGDEAEEPEPLDVQPPLVFEGTREGVVLAPEGLAGHDRVFFAERRPSRQALAV